MKVWVVYGWSVEGAQVHSVSSTLEKAKEHAAAIESDDTWRVEITEHEIDKPEE